MKRRFYKVLSLILALAVLMPAVPGAGIGVSAEDDVMTAYFETVQFATSYNEGDAWNKNATSSKKSATPAVSKVGNHFGAYASTSNSNATMELVYSVPADITSYEVKFGSNAGNNTTPNLNASNTKIYYSKDNSTWTELVMNTHYVREDIVDYRTVEGVITPNNDYYVSTKTPKIDIPEGIKYFKVYSKGKAWKSTYYGLKLWGEYDGSDEISTALKAEMAFENIANGQEANAIAGALKLPKTTGAGYELVWDSSNEGTINPETGEVTMLASENPVVLTATTAYDVNGEKVDAVFTYNLVVKADTSIGSSADIYEYGDADSGVAATADVYAKIDGYTKSQVSGETDQPMLVPYEYTLGEEKIYTLRRSRGAAGTADTNNGKEAYVIYKVSDMTSFDVDFILGNIGGVKTNNPVFELSSDGVTYTKHNTVIISGSAPEEEGTARVHYSGYNIPVGTQYLRITFPGAINSTTAGFDCEQLERVKVNNNAVLGEGFAINTDFEGSNAELSWNGVEADGDYVYEIAVDNVKVAEVEKTASEYTVEGLLEHTEYKFAVIAIAKDTDSANKTTYAETEILKTSGAENIFRDEFKFADTMSAYATWSDAIAHNSDNKTVQRAKTGDLYATYKLGNLIYDFTVDFMIYRAKATPGDSTFEVSANGTNWVAVDAVKTGNEPGNYSTVPWSYTAENIQDKLPGAKYLRIKFGSLDASRLNGVQLKAVTVSMPTKEEAEELEIKNRINAAMAWNSLFTADKDALVDNITLPSSVCDGAYAVSWTSSDEAVITKDGIITKADEAKAATLTAVVTYADGKTLTYTYDVVVLGKGGDSVSTYVFGDINGTYTIDKIYDSAVIVDYAKSYISGETDMPMYIPHTYTLNGETIYTLRRSRNGGSANNNGKAGYITYKVSDMTSFDIGFILGNYNNKKTNHPYFEVSADGKSFTKLETVAVTGAVPDTNKTVARVLFSGYDIPEGTEYLKINFPGLPDSASGGYDCEMLEKVKINERAALPAVEALDVKVDGSKAVLSWNKVESQENFVYEIVVDGVVYAECEKDAVTYTVEGLDDHTEYRFAVVAVKRSADNLANKAAFAQTEIVKVGGDKLMFRDTFKFPETLTTTKAVFSTAVAHNADNKTVQRTATGDLYATYELDDLIADFTVDFMIYQGKNVTPGDSSFEVSADGVVWIPVEAVKTGVTPANYTTVPWSYTVENVQEAVPEARFIRIKFGSLAESRLNGVQLKRVTVNMVSYAYTWPADAELEVTVANENAAVITWTEVNETGDEVYEVYVNDTLYTTSYETQAAIVNLETNTPYSVYVIARSMLDETKYSKKLTADDFITGRKTGAADEAVNPEGYEIALANTKGDVISAAMTVSGTATVGFKNAGGAFADTYVKVYAKYSEYYKNGKLLYTMKHSGESVNILTPDYYTEEDDMTLFIDGGEWSNVVVNRTAATDNVYYSAALAQAGTINIKDTAPLENLSGRFTFEADVTIPADCADDFALTLLSGNGKKLAELAQTKTFEHGKNGALYLIYENTPLYEARTWLPRLEYDGKVTNLKLYVDPAKNSVTVAMNNKVVGDKLCITDVDAADVASVVVGNGYKLENVSLKSGFVGEAYKLPVFVDAEGNAVSLLKAGDKATLIVSAVNSEEAKNIQLFARQDDKDGNLVAINTKASEALPVKEGWQEFTLEVTAAGDDMRISAFAWDTVNGNKPLCEVGGYYGSESAQNTDKRLFLIGDSTVRYVYKTGQNPPNIGWGEVIDEFLNENMTVYNYAKDGTSSKTYMQSGRLNAMKAYMREGDYLMFQLGHNDRSTTPGKGTTVEEYKTYLRAYVQEARNLGLNMIFVTPVAVQGDVSADRLNDVTKSSLYPFANAMQEVAGELDVPIIDLFRTSIEKLLAAGVTTSEKADIYTDGTHFTEAGAKLLCGYIKTLLEECEGTDLDEYFK